METVSMNNSATLSDVLHSFTPESIHWICGEMTLQVTPILWISCYADGIQPGDLVLMVASDPVMDQIRQATEEGAAAIGILGACETASFPHHGIPIFLLHSVGDLRAVQRLLLHSLLTRKSQTLERGTAIQTRLTQIAARNEGLAGLAAAMRDMTQHSILVQDKRLQPLASSPAPSLRPVWEGLLDTLAGFSTLPESMRDRRRAGETPQVTQEALPGELERMVVPIVVGDVARGYLSVIALAGELDATDRQVAEQGALVCAIEMARAKAVRETEKRLHGDLLAALLHQTLAARDARLWAQNTGLDLEAHHTAMRLAWEGSRLSLRRLETLVNGAIAQNKVRAIVSPLSGEVICFCETPREAGRPAAALTLAQSVIDHAHEEDPVAVVRCGIGAPAADLSRWHVSFRQAGQALEMARRLDERKPLYYMDLSVYRLLLQIEDHPDLRAFLQETLGPLLANENAEDFIATLEEYFAHNGNLSQTSEALFIHRNTLTYRMERIAVISGLDFTNPDTRLAAQLALRIHRMLKATGLQTG